MADVVQSDIELRRERYRGGLANKARLYRKNSQGSVSEGKYLPDPAADEKLERFVAQDAVVPPPPASMVARDIMRQRRLSQPRLSVGSLETPSRGAGSRRNSLTSLDSPETRGQGNETGFRLPRASAPASSFPASSFQTTLRVRRNSQIRRDNSFNTRIRRLSMVNSPGSLPANSKDGSGAFSPERAQTPMDVDNGELNLSSVSKRSQDSLSPFRAEAPTELTLGGGAAASGSPTRYAATVLKGFAEVSTLSVAGSDVTAWKTGCQDVCVVSAETANNRPAIVGVLDGHGEHGGAIAMMAHLRLVEALASDVRIQPGTHNAEAAADAFKEAFFQVNAHLHRSAMDCSASGTTATIAAIVGRTLHVGWVGDCRAVMGRVSEDNSLKAVALTEDHRPGNPGEKSRIEQNDGRVDRFVNDAGERLGPLRVFERFDWTPGLGVSRSLGDKVAQKLGVSPEPEVETLQLMPTDRFLVVATDGVWSFMSEQDVVDIVGPLVNDPNTACSAVVDRARQLWAEEENGNSDDVSVSLIVFHHTAGGLSVARR